MAKIDQQVSYDFAERSIEIAGVSASQDCLGAIFIHCPHLKALTQSEALLLCEFLLGAIRRVRFLEEDGVSDR